MSRRPSRKDMAVLADRLGPEDGIDPRLVRPDLTGRNVRRHTYQLCGEMARAIGAALACSADETLRDLQVVDVVPAAGGGRFLVTLTPVPSADARPKPMVEERLARAAGMLRSEVAAAVHRRRAPELVLRLV